MKLLDPKNCYKTTSSMKHGGFSTLKPLEISKDSGGKKKWQEANIYKTSRCVQRLPQTKMDVQRNWTWFLSHLGVSKNRGTPKWMVYNGKPY